MSKITPILSALFMILLFACACTGPAGTPVAEKPVLANELVFYNWVDDMPQEVLDAFTQEYGVKVKYLTYESQEEAIENMKAGQIYDVVVVEDEFLPTLIEGGALKKINREAVPNLENISEEFRDLPHDPGRSYSIPYNWGTTGLVLRSDIVAGPITSWNDLWKQENTGKVLLWKGLPRHMLGVTLKSLGFSANSENSAELEQALEKLIALKKNVIFGEDIDPNLVSSAPSLIKGEAVMAVGWNYDVLSARKENLAVIYVLPDEGALLWGDNFIIPANSPNAPTAEVFLNFLLRPEINAKITNFNHYPTPIEKAGEFVEPNVLYDPIIFPAEEDLKKMETIRPLSQAGQKLHEDTWARFLAAP